MSLSCPITHVACVHPFFWASIHHSSGHMNFFKNPSFSAKGHKGLSQFSAHGSHDIFSLLLLAWKNPYIYFFLSNVFSTKSMCTVDRYSKHPRSSHESWHTGRQNQIQPKTSNNQELRELLTNKPWIHPAIQRVNGSNRCYWSRAVCCQRHCSHDYTFLVYSSDRKKKYI